MSTIVQTYELSPEDTHQIELLVSQFRSQNPGMTAAEFALEAELLSHRLPEALKRFVMRFKSHEAASAILIRNAPVDLGRIGPTPSSHRAKGDYPVSIEEMTHMMLGSLLGNPVGFETQQNGHICNDIIAVPGTEELSNFSGGSKHFFSYHTEDSFHKTPPDYIGLMCLRNNEQCPTIVSTYDLGALDDDDVSALFEDRYLVPPNVAQARNGDRFLQQTQVFFGNRRRPFLRVNMCLMKPADYAGAAGRALGRLFESIIANQREIYMRAGDCLYVDNFSTAHARPAYRPYGDGTGRWLKRIVLYRDARRPVEFLREPTARVLE